MRLQFPSNLQHSSTYLNLFPSLQKPTLNFFHPHSSLPPLPISIPPSASTDPFLFRMDPMKAEYLHQADCCSQSVCVRSTLHLPMPSPLSTKRPNIQVSSLVSIHQSHWSLRSGSGPREVLWYHTVIQLSKIVYYLLDVSSMSTSLIEGKLCCLVLFYPKTHEVWK